MRKERKLHFTLNHIYLFTILFDTVTYRNSLATSPFGTSMPVLYETSLPVSYFGKIGFR